MLAAALVVASACGAEDDGSDAPDPADGVRVASFDFAESELLAEMYAQVLDIAGLPVVRLGAVGPREVVAPALELDVIDLVPEYLGTSADHFGASTDELGALQDVLKRRSLTALTPSAAEDVNVFVVTEETASAAEISRVSDLNAIASTASFGGPVECPERPLCLLGLRDTYGLTFAEFVPQRSLDLTAEALLRGEVDVGLMFSTAAALAGGPFVVLDDDRDLQPAENIVPIARVSAIERWGTVFVEALEEVSAALTTEELRSLNRMVADDEPIPDVARAWLVSAGLVTE